jgi:hypothetical protein
MKWHAPAAAITGLVWPRIVVVRGSAANEMEAGPTGVPWRFVFLGGSPGECVAGAPSVLLGRQRRTAAGYTAYNIAIADSAQRARWIVTSTRICGEV